MQGVQTVDTPRAVNGRCQNSGMSDEQTGTRVLVSSSAAARAVGVDRSTLTRWVQRGELRPASRTPGGHLRWDLDDLRRQLDALGSVRE